MALSVRRFDPSDAERVRELHVEAMREYDAFSPDADLDADLLDVTGEYLDGGGEFLVGERDGRIVAMGAFRPAAGYITEFVDDVDESAAELTRMRVAPEDQREGYGQRIYAALEDAARERGVTEFVLDTSGEQVAARRFYESEGFQLATRETVALDGEPVDLYCYRKSLR